MHNNFYFIESLIHMMGNQHTGQKFSSTKISQLSLIGINKRYKTAQKQTTNNNNMSQSQANTDGVEIEINEILNVVDLDDEKKAIITDRKNNGDYRKEERWHASIDKLAREWRNACAENSKRHDLAGYKARMKHLILGLPAPIATLTTAAVAGLWDSPDNKYFIVPTMCVASILNLVHIYLNLGGKAQQYWDFSARYGGMAGKIDALLCRDVDFRRPADEFMAETRAEIGNLNGNAPQLPGRGCCGCSDFEREEIIEPPTKAETDAKNRAAMEHVKAYLEANEIV